MGEGPTLDDFIAGWELFRMPALTGAVAGGVLGLLGVYVVLRRLVFLTAAVSQAAGLGVALAFYAHIHMGLVHADWHHSAGAIFLTALAVWPFALERGRSSGRRDSVLGLIFLLGSAGTLAVGTRIVEEMQDIQTILFGSAVAVLPADFDLVLLTAALLLILHTWWWRGFVSVSFDPAGAQVRGLPVALLDHLLFLSLALGIAVSTKVLGALPTFAFSVLPAMAAVMVSVNVPRALLLSTGLGTVSGFLGYVFAFLYELPVGAAQTLIAGLWVLLFFLGQRGSLLIRRSMRSD